MGADTVIPFKVIQTGSFDVQPNGVYNIDLRGKPKFVTFITVSGFCHSIIFSSSLGHTVGGYTFDNGWLVITNTGFTWKHASNWGSGKAYYAYSLVQDIFDIL